MGQTFVQLRLVVDHGGTLEHVHLGDERALPQALHRRLTRRSPTLAEMNLARFYEFVIMLEEARTKLELMG